MTRVLRAVLALTAVVACLVGAAPSAPAPAGAAATVTWSEPHAVMTGVTTPRTGSAYTIARLINGRPLHWDACTPIHWRLRAAGAPAGALAVVTSSVAQIARQTGTRWVYDGTTRAVPTSRALPTTPQAPPSVLIGWADAGSSDLLTGQARSVLGVTRTSWVGTTRNGRTDAWITSAVVALDRTNRLPLSGGVSWRTVTLHELSHAMGLDHAGSTSQLMYPVLQPRLNGLQSGDVAGLRRVGRAAGCRAT